MLELRDFAIVMIVFLIVCQNIAPLSRVQPISRQPTLAGYILVGYLLDKQVENRKASSSATSNGEHGATMAREPARRRIASKGVRRICRHLGRNLGQQPGPVINNEGKNKLSPDSIHKDRYLKQPRPIPAEDSDHDVENCVLSASSRCSLVANNQTRGSAGTYQLSEESSIKDDECIHMLEEYSLPTSFGKPSTS
ncbi:hypothetical protein Cgig2_009614 [Carnegiea gigantea]|uniref:Uncharacterized protein n=1 Tax=Carnegiea gigantea TaxID=171969 RepID=A0A9Q1Q800_9CARY|nr:hypothetical protein Cgig2_009614 [Carnegiea gigantea]